LQDYDIFFEALETEELFTLLEIDVPEDEVEFARKHQPEPVEEVCRNNSTFNCH
jgi:hypothetical protein